MEFLDGQGDLRRFSSSSRSICKNHGADSKKNTEMFIPLFFEERLFFEDSSVPIILPIVRDGGGPKKGGCIPLFIIFMDCVFREVKRIRRVSRRRTNVQQLTCNIDFLLFLLYFLLFCSHRAKALCFEGESPGGKILKV